MKMAKILVTSGGTKIPIDTVRSITNMSKGTFGSKIADEFYNEGNEVVFLGAVDSKMPFFTKSVKGFCEQKRVPQDCPLNGNNFMVVSYKTFDDYSKELFSLLKNLKFDIIVLSAAVSDYTVENFVDGKIRTKEDELVIRLKPLPKLISKVRDYQKDAVICGFKLLVNSSGDELEDACIKSIKTNKIDLVVGNDLRDIKNNNHTLSITEKIQDGTYLTTIFEQSKNPNLAKVVVSHCQKFLKKETSND